MLVRAGTVTDYDELKPVLIDYQDNRIAIYKFQDKFFAYLDVCPHQLGPACEGIIVGNTEAKILPDRTVKEFVSTERYNIACPWHGAEFDLETGTWRSDERYRLKSYRVEIIDDEVMVNILE
jgi:nitrite reductase (NADH) small subunit